MKKNIPTAKGMNAEFDAVIDNIKVKLKAKPKNKKKENKMKKILAASILAVILLGHGAAAYAACYNETVFIDGQYITCRVCCFNGNCTRTCY